MKKIVRSVPEPIKQKDRWDKAGVVAQFLSGVVIASVGAYFTVTNNEAQRVASKESADAQLKVSVRQQTSSYVNQIIAQKDIRARAELIGSSDIALTPDDAIPIALRYAHPDQSAEVVNQSLAVLRRLRSSGRNALLAKLASGTMPDAALSEAVLGLPIHVKIRVSEIDDFATLYLMRQSEDAASAITPVYGYGQDSGWLDITEKLDQNVNQLLLKVKNGKYGGTTARLEISVGTQQYDSRLVVRDKSPADADSFFIWAHIVVRDRTRLDGSIGLEVSEPYTYPLPGTKLKH